MTWFISEPQLASGIRIDVIPYKYYCTVLYIGTAYICIRVIGILVLAAVFLLQDVGAMFIYFSIIGILVAVVTLLLQIRIHVRIIKIFFATALLLQFVITLRLF